MLAFYFLLLASAYSFLLDNPQGNGGTTTTNQYLTLSKFYEEMKLQQVDTENVHRETIKLRHDTDNSLTLLTSQLQHKFDLLDKKLADIGRQNESNSDFVNLEHKYIQLEQKYLNLEQNYITQGHELAMLRNKSRLLEKNIEDLQNLGSIKPLHEITTLQQVVNSISAQTSMLNMKEQARSKDLIALYSKVQEHEVTNNRSITDLSTQMKTLQANHNASIKDLGTEITNHNTSIKDLGTQIKTLQTNHNASITDLSTELRNVEKNQSIHFVDVESKMRAATIMNNQTFIHLQRQIDNSTEQVAMTAHPLSSSSNVGVIKFDNVAFSVGINNIPTFKSSGKFVCEKEGLYLFSASISSTTNVVAMTAHPSSNSNKAGIIKFDNVAFSVGIKNITAFKNSRKFVCEKEGLYILSVKIYSNTNGAHFYISLNGNTISYTKISFNGNHPSAMENTSTAVLTVQLRLNDSVWVFYPRASHVAGSAWSTFTIVKIK